MAQRAVGRLTCDAPVAFGWAAGRSSLPARQARSRVKVLLSPSER